MVLPQPSIARLLWSNAARAVPMMWLDVLATAVVNQTWIVYRGAEFTTWLLLMSLMDIGYLPWRQRHVDGSVLSRLSETCMCYAVQWAAFRLILYPLHGMATIAALSLVCLPTPVAVRWLPLLSTVPLAVTYLGYAAYKKKLRGCGLDSRPTSHSPQVPSFTNTNVSNLQVGVYAGGPSIPSPTTSTTMATSIRQLVPHRLGLLRRLLPTNVFQMTPVETSQCDEPSQATTDLVTRSDVKEVAAPPSDEPQKGQAPLSEQTIEAQMVPLAGHSRAGLPEASQSSLLTCDMAIPVAVESAPSFRSVLSADKSSSRSSEAPKEQSSRASSSDSVAQQLSATVSMLNTQLTSSLSFLSPDDPTTYAMGVPLGFWGRVKSEANPRLVASPIARTVTERMRLCDDDAWLTQSQHYYVERLGACNKIWRLLQSLK